MSLKQMTIDNLIEITEGLALAVADINKRLDATEQPQKVALVAKAIELGQIDAYMATGKPPITVEERRANDRAAMIKALRWAVRVAPFGVANDHITNVLDAAITRLENGGEL